MGEQARRLTFTSEDFVHRSIHEAVAWHRDMRGRYRARKCVETIYYRPRETAEIVEFRPPLAKKPPNPEREAFKAESRSRRDKRVATIQRIQGDRCYLCPEPFIWPNMPTIDHVTPFALGGRNHANVLLACWKCNNRKADRAPYACEVLFLQIVNEQLTAPKVETFDRIDG